MSGKYLGNCLLPVTMSPSEPSVSSVSLAWHSQIVILQVLYHLLISRESGGTSASETVSLEISLKCKVQTLNMVFIFNLTFELTSVVFNKVLAAV